MIWSVIFGLFGLAFVAWAIVEAGHAEFADDPTKPRRVCHALGFVGAVLAFVSGVMW